MNNRKMMHAYINSEREAQAETGDPHALIAVLFDELIRSMRLFAKNIDKTNCNEDVRSKSLARALTIIYSLQSSLDFDAGGEIAANLFRLYEYARQQLLDGAKTDEVGSINLAITSLEDIREAWQQISKAPSGVSVEEPK